MAAVTPDTASAEVVRGRGRENLKRFYVQFVTQTVDDADTYAFPGPAIRDAMWKPTNSTDQVAPTFSGNTVTFNAPAGSHNGVLVIEAAA